MEIADIWQCNSLFVVHLIEIWFLVFLRKSTAESYGMGNAERKPHVLILFANQIHKMREINLQQNP